ncbi:hypothetical protein INT43_000092 [Umbelopsis isabellina]|uniref:NmrA-like domain-containing protein n=1 Tax=Mortierella isabellina TaxID=91625 RepID=A0A8H7U859_MORIS|nr:hypothetical protein INT43_000092 [Umbelopsis isabellina]
MTSGKVYVLGATGGVGTPVVKELLEKGISTTILVRDPSKAHKLFGENDNLTVIKGDYTDFDAFKNSIGGHERLFLLVRDIDGMPKIKIAFSKIGYEAGVKQVVDVSSGSVSGSWRQNVVTAAHYYSEKGIYELPNRGYYVALRPTAFFTNHFFGDDKTIRFKGIITGAQELDSKSAWISPNDIAHLAVNILTEPVEQHADMVYDMTSQRLSGNERATIISRVLGKDVKYVQVPFEQAYKNFIDFAHLPHSMAYGILDGDAGIFNVNQGLSTVLHREPETLEQWLTSNKDAFA